MEELVQELDNGYPWKQPSHSSGPEGVEGARVRGGVRGEKRQNVPEPRSEEKKSSGVEKFRNLRHQRGFPEKLFIWRGRRKRGMERSELGEEERERKRERAALHANEAAGTTCAVIGSLSRSVNIPAAGKRSFQIPDRRV